MMFGNGTTIAIPIERMEWCESFVDCTHHPVDVLRDARLPALDGPIAKTVLQCTLTAFVSVREVRPDET